MNRSFGINWISTEPFGDRRAGGRRPSAVSCGRVNGNLALSRALGDFDFKQNKSLPPALQAITAARTLG